MAACSHQAVRNARLDVIISLQDMAEKIKAASGQCCTIKLLSEDESKCGSLQETIVRRQRVVRRRHPIQQQLAINVCVK